MRMEPMNNYYLSVDSSGGVLVHSGRKGMKWGQHIYGKDRVSAKRKTIPLTDEAKTKLGFAKSIYKKADRDPMYKNHGTK